MVLKCTKEEYVAIYRLMSSIMLEKPKDIPGSLVKDLLTPIYLKMRDRVHFQHLAPNKSWNLKLTVMQAKTYFTFFEGKDFTANWEYEHYTIQLQLIEINKFLTAQINF